MKWSRSSRPPVVEYAESVFRMLPNTLFVRAADALHLSSARQNGFTKIHSSDKHLLQAASAFALHGINVIQPAIEPADSSGATSPPA